MSIAWFDSQGLWSGLLLRSHRAMPVRSARHRAMTPCTCEPLEPRTLASVGLPIVTIRATAAASEQGQKPGTIVLNRSGDLSQPLAVTWLIDNTSTATETDFQNLPLSATIPAGVRSVKVFLTPVDDLLPDRNESLRLVLQPGENFVLSSNPNQIAASVRIIDNEPTVSVSAVDSRASEGGNNPGRFRFSRTGPTVANLTVNFSIPQDAAGDITVGSDFADPGAVVTIPAGQRFVDLVINPIDDSLAEGTERLTVFLEDGNYYWATGRDEAELLISDNEFVPVASVRATDSTATEAADTGTWTITLSAPALQDTPVYFTFSGSAVNGTDFVELNNYFTIPQGQTQATVTLNPYDENIREGTESSTLRLALGTGYNVSSKANRATIRVFDPGSDLTLLSVSNPMSLIASANAVFPVAVDLINRGSTPSGPFYVEFTLKPLQIGGSGQTYLMGEIDIAQGLSAGFAALATLTTPIQEVPPPGIYRVFVRIDSRNEVTERDENNNYFFSSTLVQVS